MRSPSRPGRILIVALSRRARARIYRAMPVQAGAIVGALVGIAGIVVGALRLLG